jgi:hypothetical protein
MKVFRLALILSLSLISSAFAQDKYDKLVQIVVDDTGLMQDAQDRNEKTARETLLRLLKHVSQEYDRNDHVVVISQYSAGNVWAGQPRDITRARANAGLSQFLQSKWSGCSDLLPLFRILDDNTFLYPAYDHEVIFFSSLVHSGRPCSNNPPESPIGLPSQFLTELGDFDARFNPTVSFYWVFDEENAQIREALLDFVREKSLDYTVKVEAETRTERF